MAVGAVDKGIIALAPLVGHAGQVGIPLFAVFAHHRAVVVGVGGQEVLWVVVTVHDDLAQSIVDVGVVAACRTHITACELARTQLQIVWACPREKQGARCRASGEK